MEVESANKTERESKSRSRSRSVSRESRSRSRKSQTKGSNRKSSSSSSDSGSSGGRKSRESSLEERRRRRREKRKSSRSSSRERFILNRERSKHRLQNSYIPRRPYGRRGNMRSPPRQRFGYRQRYNNYSPRNWSPRKRFGGGRDNDRHRDDGDRYRDSRRRSRDRRDSRDRDSPERDYSPDESREEHKDDRKSSERQIDSSERQIKSSEKEKRSSSERQIPLEYLTKILPDAEKDTNARANLNSDILKEVDDKLAVPTSDITEVLNIIDSTTPDLNFLKKHKKSKASDESSSDDSSSSGRRKRKHKSKTRKKHKKEKKKKRKKDKKHETKVKSKKIVNDDLKTKVKANDAEELLKLITGPNEIKAPLGLPPVVSDLDLQRDSQKFNKTDTYSWPPFGSNPEPGNPHEKSISEYGELPEKHADLDRGRESRKRLRHN